MTLHRPANVDDKQALEKIVPEVVAALAEFEARWTRSLPVIAAGGIFTGEDIYRFLKLGAKGVQMGETGSLEPQNAIASLKTCVGGPASGDDAGDCRR